MKTFLVPEKYAPMWTLVATGIEAAQGWCLDAHKARDEPRLRIYTKMVADRISAMTNLQAIIFGDKIREISALRGGGTVHSMIQIDPPGMVVFDNDQEYYEEAKGLEAEIERDGAGIQVHAHVPINQATKPIDMEGMD